jgi:PAS domain-containing protein
VKSILITVEVALIIYAVVLLIIQQHFERFYLLGGIAPVLLYIHLLLWRKRTRQAAIVGAWCTWLAVSISAFTSGGVYSPTYYSYTIPILIGGLLIERRAGIFFALASALLGLLMIGLVDQPGLASGNLPLNSSVLRWLIGSLIFGIVAILQYVEVSNLTEALSQAQRHEHTLAETNQILQIRTQELEEREHALHQSETQLRALVQALPDALVRVRQDGTTRFYSECTRTATDWAQNSGEFSACVG